LGRTFAFPFLLGAAGAKLEVTAGKKELRRTVD